MANIKFSESEKSELIRFYELELSKSLERVGVIKGILGKFNGKQKRIHRTKTQITSAVKPKKQTTVRSQHKKVTAGSPGKTSKVKWVRFIPDTIKKQKRFLTTNEILKFATKKFNIPDKRKGYKSLAQTLANMRKKGRVISEKKKGDKLNYFGLPS